MSPLPPDESDPRLARPVGEAAGWRRRSTKFILESPWYRIRQDEVDAPNKHLTYTFIEHPGAVFIIPVNAKGEVALIRIYRYPSDVWLWEVPSGGIGDKPGHSLEEVAREEMKEEAGCVGGRLERLGTYYSANGAADIRVHYYLARDVEFTGRNAPEPGEAIAEVAFVPFEEALERAYDGRIADGDSAFALMLAARAYLPRPAQK